MVKKHLSPLLLFLFALVPFFFSSCKRGANEKELIKPKEEVRQEVRLSVKDEPHTLDPRKVRSLSDVNFAKMFFEGLTRVGLSGKASLALAEKMDLSDDLRTYTISLKKSHWSDGEPLTAHDFVHSWKTSLSPHFSSPNAHMLFCLNNGKEVKEGKLPPSLLGVEALDDWTLKVELTTPIPFFLDLVSHPVFLPVPSRLDQLSSSWADREETFVSNGPFSIEKWERGKQLSLVKNQKYWDLPSVKLHRLSLVIVSSEVGIDLFQKGDLNWSGSPFSIVPRDALPSLKKDCKVEEVSNLATHFIRVNTGNPFLKNVDVRRSLALAINREELVSHVTQGGEIAATSLVPSCMNLSHVPYFQDGDVEAAKVLLRKGLGEENMTFEEIPPISLLYPSSDNNRKIAESLQAQWKEALGFFVTLEGVEGKVFFERISKGAFSLSMGSWYADFQDPINFLENFKTKTLLTNKTQWENSVYQKLLEESYFCAEESKRKELLRKSEEILLSEVPIIPLYHATMLYLKDENLCNVVFTSNGTVDFKWAYFGEKKEEKNTL